MGNSHVLILLSKNEWVQFVRYLIGTPAPGQPKDPNGVSMTENEITDLFLLFLRKLDVSTSSSTPTQGSLGNKLKDGLKQEEGKQLLTKEELEMRDLRLELQLVDALFDKWYK